MKRKMSAPVAALFTSLICILLSGAGVALFATSIRPTQLHMQATSIASNFLTAQVKSMQQAQVAATTQAQETISLMNELYRHSTSSQPVYSDPLSESNNPAWSQSVAGPGCNFTHGAYQDVISIQATLQSCFYQSAILRNFAFQVQMTLLQGDGGGIIFRGTATTNVISAYYFSFAGYSYSLFEYQNGHPHILTNGYLLANQHQSHLLTVIAKGSNFYLYVDSQYLDSVSDNTLSSGAVGVFAEDSLDPTAVSFNNAQIWQL